MSERNLTAGEINMLRTVYGNSIDYSKITLDNRVIRHPNQQLDKFQSARRAQ